MKEVLFATRRDVGIVTLNRPNALNALSIEMITTMTDQLLLWASDAQIQMIFLNSSIPKAFCAGGDVKYLHACMSTTSEKNNAAYYLAREYFLDYLIHNYPKPVIALLDGMTLGGGMGLAQGADWRLITAHSKMAMPEAAIGLIPDVGCSYFLNHCCSSSAIARYLISTGGMIDSALILAAGLADALVETVGGGEHDGGGEGGEHWESFIYNLCQMSFADREVFLQKLSQNQPPQSEDTQQRMGVIEQVFDEKWFVFDNDRQHILNRLDRLPAETSDTLFNIQLCKRQLLMGHPLAIERGLDAFAEGGDKTLKACFYHEFLDILTAFETGMGIEGIRAKLIDKVALEVWRPVSMDQFQSVRLEVEQQYAPIWRQEFESSIKSL